MLFLRKCTLKNLLISDSQCFANRHENKAKEIYKSPLSKGGARGSPLARMNKLKKSGVIGLAPERVANYLELPNNSIKTFLENCIFPPLQIYLYYIYYIGLVAVKAYISQ